MAFVKTKSELIKALRAKDDTIEIDEELSRQVIKLRDLKIVSWAVAFVSLVLAMVIILISGESIVSAFAMISSASAGILGYSIAISFMLVAIIAGIITMYNYKGRKKTGLYQYRIILSKK